MGNFTTVPDVTVGESFPPSLWESAIMTNLNLGVARQLADTTLAASAATVSFTSIPSTFAHLIGVLFARTTSATTTSDAVTAQMNGDTSANYDSEHFLVSGTASTAFQTFGATSASIGTAVGGGAAAGLFSACLFVIPQYAGAAANKVWLTLYAAKWGTASGNLEVCTDAAFWRSSAAINQITFLPGSGSFAANSRFTLYGLPS